MDEMVEIEVEVVEDDFDETAEEFLNEFCETFEIALDEDEFEEAMGLIEIYFG